MRAAQRERPDDLDLFALEVNDLRHRVSSFGRCCASADRGCTWASMDPPTVGRFQAQGHSATFEAGVGHVVGEAKKVIVIVDMEEPLS